MYFLEDFIKSDASEEENIPPETRQRGVNRVWLLVKKFENSQEAEEQLKDWSISATKNTIQGVKVEYRCKKGGYRKNECPLRMLLLYHSDSFSVSLFKTDAQHAHSTPENSMWGLSCELKKFIKEKFNDGIEKPNALLELIKRSSLNEPPKSKIIHYLKILRKEKYGNNITSADIISWSEARRNIPEDEDTPFVLKYMVEYESANAEDQKLKLFISTKRLLKNISNSMMVQIDATYKLVWQGYPVFVIGTSDKNNVFHPFGLGMCDGESTGDYEFVFGALKNYNEDWHPSILLADASSAITEGFSNVFGPPKIRLMCYFHVVQNIEKHLKPLKERKELKNDINLLQVCNDEDMFKTATSLFFKKWEVNENVKDFLKYFKKQWVDKNGCWFEGAAIGYPSTNNGIEATNNLIKKEHTFRERLPVGQFLSVLENILNKWSTGRNPESPNCKLFNTIRNIPQNEWTVAYQWARLNKSVVTLEDSEYFYFFVNSALAESQDIVSNQASYSEKFCNWANFEEFKKVFFSVWIILLSKSNMNESVCSCSYFLKHSSCKHVLGIKIRNKLLVVPDDVKMIPLGQKRKRDRPAKASRALILQ